MFTSYTLSLVEADCIAELLFIVYIYLIAD